MPSDAFLSSEASQGWARIARSLVAAWSKVVRGWFTMRVSRGTKAPAGRGSQGSVTLTLEAVLGSPSATQQTIREPGDAAAFDIGVAPRDRPSRPRIRSEQARRRLASLPHPGQSLSVDGILSTNVHGTSFWASAGGRDAPGSRACLELVRDVGAAGGLRAAWRGRGRHDTAELPDKIHRELSRSASGHRKARVDAFSQGDWDRARAERERDRQGFLADTRNQGAET